MFRVSRWLLPLMLLLGSCGLLAAQDEHDNFAPEANSKARIVRLSFIEGTVQINTGNGAENATMNVPVTEGTRLLTRANGWAEVQFEDGSTVRLAPETQLTFAQLSRTPSGKTVTSVNLDQGEAEFKVAAHDGAEFAVNAGMKTVLLKHSGRFRVKSTSSDPLEVAVLKGEVAVRDAALGKDVAVKKNETFSLDQSDPAHYELEKRASVDELDRWSKQRDTALSSSYASAESYTQSPYQYGVGDLGYYGQFYDVAGYGPLWQPYGMYPGWDPFMNGYWSYSPAFGYCWVSAYPWGWMPYRYGQWVFINGRGWFWQPGGWSGWARAPRFVNAPHGFQAPVPPVQLGTGVAPGTRRTPGVTVMEGRPAQPGRVLTNQGEQPAVRAPRSGSEMSTKPATEMRHQAPAAQPRPAPAPPATPRSAPPASVPHSAPPPAAAPHSPPAPHILALPHVSAPVHK